MPAGRIPTEMRSKFLISNTSLSRNRSPNLGMALFSSPTSSNLETFTPQVSSSARQNFHGSRSTWWTNPREIKPSLGRRLFHGSRDCSCPNADAENDTSVSANKKRFVITHLLEEPFLIQIYSIINLTQPPKSPLSGGLYITSLLALTRERWERVLGRGCIFNPSY